MKACPRLSANGVGRVKVGDGPITGWRVGSVNLLDRVPVQDGRNRDGGTLVFKKAALRAFVAYARRS